MVNPGLEDQDEAKNRSVNATKQFEAYNIAVEHIELAQMVKIDLWNTFKEPWLLDSVSDWV